MPLVLAILFTGFTPQSFSSVESEAREDIQAGCRDGNTLVHRFAYKDYVCVSPDTAKRWEELGLAEIQGEFEVVEKTPQPIKLKPQFEETPPPPKKTPTVTNTETGCRDGYSLVFRFIYHDTFCTSPSTAASWERLGLAEIIAHANPAKIVPEPQITSEPTRYEESDYEDDRDDENEFNDEIETVNDVEEKKTIIEKPIRKTTTANYVLPPYPEQSSIHSEILIANEQWSPPSVHKVNDRIWVAVGYDVANSIMIEGNKGIIIIDTLSSYESAKKVLSEFRKITEKPVKTIILTHGHLDHVQGTKAFLESGDGDVEIVAHESMLDLYLNENAAFGAINEKRGAYASGLLLPESGIDEKNLGVFAPMVPGSNGFVPPTHTFSSEFSLDISNVGMELIHVGGESSDQIYVWLPEDKALLTGDNFYHIFPNIYSISGSYREPMNFVHAFDKALLMEPDHLIPSHSKPISGNDKIKSILISTRDATQFIHDQTLRGIDNGYTANELSQMITLPEWFEERSWLTQVRSEIPWHVKQIYYEQVGWFDGNPSSLVSVSDDDRAKKIIEGFGGIDYVLDEIRMLIDNEDYVWASELATYVLQVDPDNSDAKSLKAFTLRVLGQQMISSDGRNWALTSALELEGKIDVDSLPTNFDYEQLNEIPIANLLKILPTKINPENLDEDVFVINIVYPDLDQTFTLYFRNGILLILDETSDSEDSTITLDSETHKKILFGNMSFMEGFQSGKIQVNGNLNELDRWMTSIEPLTFGSSGMRD